MMTIYLTEKIQFATLVIAGAFLIAPLHANAQSSGLKLPEDLAAKAQTEASTYTVEERRVGGRLDRVTIRRENGIDETYENTNVDSMWQTEDNELGQTQQMRRWTIGSW